MLILQHVLQFNCFDTSTTGIYQSQQENLILSFKINFDLPDNQLYICENVITNNHFNLIVTVGNEKFQILNQLFTIQDSYEYTLECQVEDQCSHINIQKYLVANFQLNFIEVNIQINGVINTYKERLYDHTNCFDSSTFKYQTLPPNEQFDVRVFSSKRCSVNMNVDTELTEKIIIINLTSNTTLFRKTTNMASPDNDYIQSYTNFEQLCSAAADIGLCRFNLLEAVTSDSNQIYLYLQTNIKVNGRNFKQTFQKHVTSIENNDVTDDCYESIEISFDQDEFTMTINPGRQNACGKEYFNNYFQFDIIQINFLFAKKDNPEKEQFKNYLEIKRISFNTSYTLTINCSKFGNVQMCNDQFDYLQNMTNDDYMVCSSTLYDKNMVMKYKMQIPIRISSQKYKSVNLTITEQNLTIYFLNSSITTNLDFIIYIKINNVLETQFDASVVVNVTNYTYILNEMQMSQVRKLKNEIKYDFDVTIGSEKVQSVQANIYVLQEFLGESIGVMFLCVFMAEMLVLFFIKRCLKRQE